MRSLPVAENSWEKYKDLFCQVLMKYNCKKVIKQLYYPGDIDVSNSLFVICFEYTVLHGRVAFHDFTVLYNDNHGITPLKLGAIFCSFVHQRFTIFPNFIHMCIAYATVTAFCMVSIINTDNSINDEGSAN